MAPVIVNVNNKLLIKDQSGVWIWGQVQDVNTAELLVDFDIPGKEPRWIPLKNVFIPPADRHVQRLSRDKGTPNLHILFAAVRDDECEPYLWKRYACEDYNSQCVFAEIPLTNNAANGIVPHIRTFRSKFSSDADNDDIFSCNPVTPVTFYKTYFSADRFGTQFLRSVLKSKYISLNKSGSEVAALVIRKNEVIVIEFRKDSMVPRPSPSGHLHPYFWDLFCALGYWDWQRYKNWESEITEWEIKDNGRPIQMPTSTTILQESENCSEADDEPFQSLPRDIILDIFSHLDTIHQSSLRRVCTEWNGLLTVRSITNHVYLLEPRFSACPIDCGLIPLSTPGNWWYAGRCSFEYRSAKVLCAIDNHTLSLRLSKLASADIKPFLQASRILNTGDARTRILILEDCEMAASGADDNYIHPTSAGSVVRIIGKVIPKTLELLMQGPLLSFSTLSMRSVAGHRKLVNRLASL